jgi:hypothetical protein
MKAPSTRSIACMIGGFTLMASLLVWNPELFGLVVRPPPASAEVRSKVRPASNPAGWSSAVRYNPAALPYPGNSMLGYDEMLEVVRLARKMESMILAAEAPLAGICPQGLRDPDGRLGIFIVCSRPLVTPTKSPGMDDGKAWVVLSVFAAVKYCGDCPVKVDYIGLTDPRGMSGEGWYYDLNMNAARRVQRSMCSGGLTLEQGYDQIVAAWRRVTPAGCRDYDREAAAIGASGSY